MADDKKKSKIDLKARLGKTATSSGIVAPVPLPVPGPSSSGGSAPPAADSNPSSPGTATPVPAPSVRPSTPMGIAPPPGLSAGLSPGIPLPPFAQSPRRAEAAPKPSAAQQTIKVEVGEEIIEERKKLAKRAALYSGIAAVLAFGIGFGLGGVRESGARATAAAKGAGILEKDVKAANEKMKELDEKLKTAYEKLNPPGDAATKASTRAFPDDLAATLGGINIPFDATNLENKPGENKQVGNLPGKILRPLLAYTSAVEDINKTKDSLKNVLGLVKDPIVNSWKEEKDPMANYAVVFRAEGTTKVVAELAPIKKPFSWKGDWGNDFAVSRLENGKPADKTAKRYGKGDLPGGDLQGVPVDPKTMAGLTGGDVRLGQLNKAISDILKELDGGANPDDPANDKVGLIKQGEDLALQLKNASLNQ